MELRDLARGAARFALTRLDSAMPGGVVSRVDGWADIVRGTLGTSGVDPRMGIQYRDPVSLSRGQLDQLFRFDALTKRIIRLPVRDMTRRWLDVTATKNQELAHDVEKDLALIKAKAVLKRAMWWGRLYGGGLVFMFIDDGRDPSEPVDEANIRAVDGLDDLDRWDVQPVYPSGSSKTGTPEHYRLASSTQSDRDDMRIGQLWHPSRVLRFGGAPTANRQRQTNDGWDDSEIVCLYEKMRDYGATIAHLHVLVQEWNRKWFQVGNMDDILLRDAGDEMRNRILTLNALWSAFKFMPLAGDESMGVLGTSVEGIDKLIDAICGEVSASVEIPQTKLFGRAPSGLTSSDDNATDDYNERIEADQGDILEPECLTLIRYLGLSRSKDAADELGLEFRPLRTPSPKEAAEIRLATSQADDIDIASGVLYAEEVSQSRYGGRRYNPHEVTLDLELREATKDLDDDDPANGGDDDDRNPPKPPEDPDDDVDDDDEE